MLAVVLPDPRPAPRPWVIGPALGPAGAGEGPRPRLLHRLRPPVQSGRRLELRPHRDRDGARHVRSHGCRPGGRRRRAARRRRARPPHPGGAPLDPGRGPPPPDLAPGARGAHRRLGGLLGVRRRSSCSGTSIASTSGADLAVQEVRAVQSDLRDRARFSAELRNDRYRNTPGDRLLPASAARTSCSCSSRATGSSRSRGPPSRRRSTPSSTREPDSSPTPASRPEAGGSPPRPSAAEAGWRTPRCSRVPGSTARGATTSSSGAIASRSRRRSGAPGGGRSPTCRRTPGLAGGNVVLPLRQDLRPPEPRVSRPEVRLRLDARPVRPARPAAARAGEAPPSTHLRRGRPGVEPHAVDPHPAADRLEPRRRRVDLQPAADRQDRPQRHPQGYARSIKYSLRALFSFVQHYGDKNLVLVVLGDHQPSRVVSGTPRSRRADLDHRPRPGGDAADRRLGLGGRDASRPRRRRSGP